MGGESSRKTVTLVDLQVSTGIGAAPSAKVTLGDRELQSIRVVLMGLDLWMLHLTPYRK